MQREIGRSATVNASKAVEGGCVSMNYTIAEEGGRGSGVFVVTEEEDDINLSHFLFF